MPWAWPGSVALPHFVWTGDSDGEQHATTQQVEAGAAIHLTLEKLELRDLALGLSVTSERGQCSPDGIAVLFESRRKGLHGAHTARASLAQLRFEGPTGPRWPCSL
jgi:hypothetical protein